MKMPENRFLRAISSFEPQLGVWHSINLPMVSEIVAGAGFDWAVVDMEHTPNEVETVLHQLQAFSPYETAAMVRPPTTEPIVAKRLMDIGARNLLFPMIDTGAEAADAVSSVRYPPKGIRGMALYHRGNQFGQITDYMERVDSETAVILQVESRQAVENLEEITMADGVSGIFFGPADLSADCGFKGGAKSKEVWDLIKDCAARVRKMGKPAGTLVGTTEQAKDLFDKGMTFVAVGGDSGTLINGLRKTVEDIKG